MKDKPGAFRYYVDRVIRSSVMWLAGRVTFRETDAAVELRREHIKRILLVRGLFRLGDSVLAIPAILLARENFPHAKIDFVGPPVTKGLFRNLPIDNYLEIHQSLPEVLWSYFALIKRLRGNRYDLAIDVSGSSTAMGSFIVGFSRARWRVGVRGKWDHWFNVRLARPAEKNKYGNLPELIGSLGLRSGRLFPTVMLSLAEIAKGKAQIGAGTLSNAGAIVGIFVGGRRTKGKRWDMEKFVALAVQLRGDGLRPIIFVGPEEQELVSYFREVLSHRAPVLFEPSVRGFAALVSNCDLFVACDSGPVHLACALRVRTVAIFLKDNHDRWGPPAELARIVYGDGTVTVAAVADACRLELRKKSIHRWLSGETGYYRLLSRHARERRGHSRFSEFSSLWGWRRTYNGRKSG